MIVPAVIILIAVSIVGWMYWIQKFSRAAKLIAKFPSKGPTKPIIGHAWDFSKDLEKLAFHFYYEMTAGFKETFSFWTGPYYHLIIMTADDAEIIFSSPKHIDKGTIYSVVFESWLRAGLLTSTGKKWQHRRKMLTPAFHYNILQDFVEVLGEQCNNLTNLLTAECGKPKTDILPIITMMTLSTICETSLGCKLDQTNKNLKSYCKGIHDVAEITVARTSRVELYGNFTYYMSSLYWRERKAVKYLRKFTSDLIKDRIKTFKVEDVEDMVTNNKKSERRLAMLDLMLYAKHLGDIDDEGIQEEVDTFVFEGHDTTTAAASFALLLLANHRDVQDKVIAELDEMFGRSNRRATFDDLQNMKYLELCLKESLRLFPSVPVIARLITEDVPLTHHVAPAQTEVWINIHAIHRDPKYFPDPERFDPDRFLPENVIGRPPYAYIPFSAGPRNCIGQKFAMLELKSIISATLRKFRMEPVMSPEDVIFSMDMVLRTRRPLYVKFVLRNDIK